MEHDLERERLRTMREEAMALAARTSNNEELGSAANRGRQLIDAALTGDVALVRSLLANNNEDEAGAKGRGEDESGECFVNARDDESASALHWAAAYNEAEIVALLLAHRNIEVNARNKRRNTPLHTAVLGGAHRSLQRLLADERVDVDAFNMWHETPLVLAAQSGDRAAALALLLAGADPAHQDQWGDSAANVADSHGQPELAKMLREFDLAKARQEAQAQQQQQPESTAPTPAATATATVTASVRPQALSKLMEAPLNDEQFMQWLRRPELDINGADMYRWCAVHKLASWNKAACLEALLRDQRLSDPMLRGQDGDTPLHIALQMGASRAADVLLSDERVQRTAVEAVNDAGHTCLHVAVATQQRDVVQRLLAMRASPKVPCRAGRTPYHLAHERHTSDPEIVALLEAELSDDERARLQAEVQQQLQEEREREERAAAAAAQRRAKRFNANTKFAALANALGATNPTPPPPPPPPSTPGSE